MNPGNAWRRRSAGEAAASSDACSTYVARHSAYLDGELTVLQRTQHEAHEAECASCSRYADVLRRGSTLLRGLPDISPATDFYQRLQHRLYHVQDRVALAPHRSRRTGWLAAAAGLVLVASSSLAIDAWLRGHNQPAAGNPGPATAEWPARQLADTWKNPPVPPVIRTGTASATFAAYSPVVVRPPLYQPVTYDLLAGE